MQSQREYKNNIKRTGKVMINTQVANKMNSLLIHMSKWQCPRSSFRQTIHSSCESVKRSVKTSEQ